MTSKSINSWDAFFAPKHFNWFIRCQYPFVWPIDPTWYVRLIANVYLHWQKVPYVSTFFDPFCPHVFTFIGCIYILPSSTSHYAHGLHSQLSPGNQVDTNTLHRITWWNIRPLAPKALPLGPKSLDDLTVIPPSTSLSPCCTYDGSTKLSMHISILHMIIWWSSNLFIGWFGYHLILLSGRLELLCASHFFITISLITIVWSDVLPLRFSWSSGGALYPKFLTLRLSTHNLVTISSRILVVVLPYFFLSIHRTNWSFMLFLSIIKTTTDMA